MKDRKGTFLNFGMTDEMSQYKRRMQCYNTILKAYTVVQDATGVNAFAPVEETPLKGVPTLLSGDPVALTKKGAIDVPILLGFTSNECQSFQRRFKSLDLVNLLESNPAQLLPRKLLFTLANDTIAKLTAEVKYRYFTNEITLNEYMNLCSDSLFVYPALKLAQIQAENGASDTFLYEFDYVGEFRPAVVALQLDPFQGVAHVEDLNYVFRNNKILNEYHPNTPVDDRMRVSWIDTIINFMKCSRPVCGKNANSWPPVSSKKLAYQHIKGPGDFHFTPIPEGRQQMINFFDQIGQLK